MKKLLAAILLLAFAFPALAQNTVRNGTLFASAARTASVTGQDMSNDSYKCLVVVLDITAVPTVETLTLTIQGKDVLSGKYYTLLAGTTEAAAATRTYSVCPGITVAANVSAAQVLPQTWRVNVAASASGSFTYSVGYSISY